ncbi:MAG: AAA family ATPase, partial [Planctomycetota bacterium]
ARWWSKHPNDNIGMNPEANGRVVLDLDLYKEECNWDRYIPETMTVSSASGGEHHYFEDGGLRFPGKFGGYEAVDIKHRGVVVLPPSRFEHGVYEWGTELGAAELPDWFPTKVQVTVDPMAAALLSASRGTDVERLIEVVRQAENTIEDREAWLAIGNGLHFEAHGTQHEDAARDAWIAWCRRWNGSDDDDTLELEAIKMWDHAAAPEEVLASGKRPMTGGSVMHYLRPKTPELPTVNLDDGEYVAIDGDQLLKTELPDIDWLVDDMIPAGDLISIAGPSGVGKTRYIALLIACLLTGRTDLMGLPAANKPISTLYFANEEKGEDLQRRIKAAMHANGLVGGRRSWVRGKDAGRVRFLTQDQGMLVPNLELLDQIVDKVKRDEIELVIFDPFNTLGGEEENSAASVDQIISCFQYIAQHTGAAVMFIHHTPKDRSEAPDALSGDSNAWRGSGAIFSALDEGFTLFPFLPPSCRVGKNAKDNRRKLFQMQRDGQLGRYIVTEHAKQREGETLPATVYQFVSHPVKTGGKPIGALQWVPLTDAEQELEDALSGVTALADAGQRVAWASALVSMLGEGEHFVTLTAIDQFFRENHVEFWDHDGKDKILRSRGRGAKLLEVLASQTRAVNHFVALDWDEKRSPTKRLKVLIRVSI